MQDCGNSTAGQDCASRFPGAPWRFCIHGGAAVLAVGILGALFLRLAAALDNFWLDEVFTYYLAMSMNSVWDAITKVRIEHHTLNTMYMYIIGNQTDWVWYRLLSVVTGTASVAVLGCASLRKGLPETIAVITLSALSYPLVVYSSEARGYAPAMFFSLTCFLLVREYMARRSIALLPLFWASAALAVFSHAASACICLSLAAWTLWRELRCSRNLIAAIVETAKCHLVPLAFIACLYLLVMRKSTSIGGAVLPLPGVLMQTLCLMVGSPPDGIWRVAGVAAALACLCFGLYAASKKEGDLWVFYACALLVTPALMLLLANREYVYPRYFVVLFPFFFLMVAQALSWAFQRAAWGKWLYVAALVLMAAGNICLSADLFTAGRGGYLKAMEYMASHTPRNEITVGSDHDFRNGIMIKFYARYLPADKRFSYVQSDSWPAGGVDWAILHTTPGAGERDPEQSVQAKGGTYTLAKTYRCCSLSGVNWFIYRNDSRIPER